MSGHSKWANIKHKKEATDKKKGKIFSRFAKEIMVAARTGGGNPADNARLRTVLAAARAGNMPRENIDRAIKKGTGELTGANFEEITYEGYGPGGTALLVECLTDNRNRTAGEIRMLFDRNNGNMAGSGAVMWMFNRKARFVISGEYADEEKLMDIVLDAGADDIQAEEGMAEISGAPDRFGDLAKALEDKGIKTEDAGIVQVPQDTIEIKDPELAKKIQKLVDALEDCDDAQAVYSNHEIDADILNSIS
ncbi:MAG: transcriptional regulator [Lentisphaerae bacterium GWF2_45_14]|nr:MAG: transcriptional regulator [Lentisphaerae bacterium GWF2_45_14]